MYNGIAQLFPGVALSFLPRRPRAFAIGAGNVAAIGTVASYAARGAGTAFGANVGFVALGVNLAVVGASSLALAILRNTVKRMPGRDAL